MDLLVPYLDRVKRTCAVDTAAAVSALCSIQGVSCEVWGWYKRTDLSPPAVI